MAYSIITSAEKNFLYLSKRIEIVAKEALILLAKTISKLVFRVQFFFMENSGQKRALINQVSNALGQNHIWTWTRDKNLKDLGLSLINDFYACVSNQSNVYNAFKGTWEILKINFE